MSECFLNGTLAHRKLFQSHSDLNSEMR